MKHSKDDQVFTVLANTDSTGRASCAGGDCPTVYELDEDHVLIQGYEAREMFEDSFIPSGENVVKIPRGLLRQLAERHGV